MKATSYLITSLLLAITGLTGCATAPGPFNGLGSDPMRMLVIYRTDDQPLTREQYAAIGKVAQKMNIQIGWQLSSGMEAALSSGVAYAAAGAAGGATQGIFYEGAMVGAAAGYTGAVYGLGGTINGLVTASYANVYAVGAATEQAIRDMENDGERSLHRIHVVAAFVRSHNSTQDPASGLAARMPKWNGIPAGTPIR